jgi:hypothetical protein
VLQNREIRAILEHFGLIVSRLTRISYGPFSLSKLPQGCVLQMHAPRWLVREAEEFHAQGKRRAEAKREEGAGEKRGGDRRGERRGGERRGEGEETGTSMSSSDYPPHPHVVEPRVHSLDGRNHPRVSIVRMRRGEERREERGGAIRRHNNTH